MPLSDAQRDHLGQRLREERERVLGALARYGDALDATPQDAAGDLTKVPYHPADEGTDTFARELDAQESSRLTAELHAIDDALDHLYRDPASFGRDETTGSEIPFARLDVIPWVRHAI